MSPTCVCDEARADAWGFCCGLSAHAKEIRPIPAARPLPPSHELLAIQSYLLASAYNVLPTTIDPSVPLDANSILAVNTHLLGEVGSPKEKAWFKDLETEREDEIVIWYGGNGYVSSLRQTCLLMPI